MIRNLKLQTISIITSLALAFTLLGKDFDTYLENLRKEEELFRVRQQQGAELILQQQRAHATKSRREFVQWRREKERKFREYREQIINKWGEFITPSNTQWVEYSSDGESVSYVDFKTGTVTIEILNHSKDQEEDIIDKITESVERVVSSRGSGCVIPVHTDEDDKAIHEKPILKDQVQLRDGTPVEPTNADALVNELKTEGKIETLPAQIPGSFKTVISFPLAPEHLQKRMEPYLPYIHKYSKKYNLRPDKILAIIHTESWFNPMAISSANAVGLMQLVPESGGADAYAFVYGSPAIPTQEFLFDPKRNIELGCAYLFILNTRYFHAVNGTVKRNYCTISAYNTGPGNVAFAFTGNRRIGDAIPIINSFHTEQQLFDFLTQTLPYSETRNYLQKVVERMSQYEPLYLIH
ncbi:Membrane-bound lytic murein transglycosylase C precursor [Chitinispirillum alkaliphilum]|nr:Membrane-bound lytic murein transglycosylase C precursor [Chitinispirillum alkaliphilum]